MDTLGKSDIYGFSCYDFSYSYTSSRNTVRYIVPSERLCADCGYNLRLSADGAVDGIVKITIEERKSSGEINGVSWQLSDDGVLTIDGEDLEQAEAEDGYYIWQSFIQETKKIVLGKKVTTIPYDTFGDFRMLESLELPEGLLEIGDYAFRGCKKLKNVVLPTSLKTIETGAFNNCGFKGIAVPKSVENIGTIALGYDEYDNLIDGFYIIGKVGSTAENYANENNINFIDEDNPAVPISSCDVTLPKSVAYDGNAVEPNVQVSFDSEKLVEGTDYTLSYKNNNAVGTGSVTITGMGKYTGSISYDFEIKMLQKYEKKIVTGNSWIIVSNEYYNDETSDYEYAWSYSDGNCLTAESSDVSVCKVLDVHGEISEDESENEQNVYMKIQGVQAGDAVITVKDQDGTILFKYNITVNNLPDDVVVFEDDALQGQMLNRYDSNDDGYLSKEEVEKIKSIYIEGTYCGEQVQSLKGIEKVKNATSFNLEEGSAVSDFTVLGQLTELKKFEYL